MFGSNPVAMNIPIVYFELASPRWAWGLSERCGE